MFAMTGYALRVRVAKPTDPGCDRLPKERLAWCYAVEGEDMATCTVLVVDQRTSERVFAESTLNAAQLDAYQAVGDAAVNALSLELGAHDDAIVPAPDAKGVVR